MATHPTQSGSRRLEPTLLSKPTSVPAWRVRAIVPCFNRRADAELLLNDLAKLDLDGGRLGLSVLLVDNASSEPLSNLATPDGLDLRHLRLGHNTGGSGGFSKGMEAWLAGGARGDPHELLWLLDSDARVDPAALRPLVEALERHPELAGAGSALVDPITREVFEVGGEVDPRTGEYTQSLPRDWKQRDLIPAGYIAACSLLVRRTVVEQVGPMADLFINGDDVEWCYRARAVTGLGFAVATASRAVHPNPDKMRTWSRYYTARNALTAMAAAGVDRRRTRFRRAMREVGRAACQVLVGRDDLAALHLWGLRDARLGVTGAAPAGMIAFEPYRPMETLDRAIKEALQQVRGRILLRRGVLPDPAPLLKSLNAVCVAPDVVMPMATIGTWSAVKILAARLWRRPAYGVAVVSARGRPDDWLAARVVITVAPEGYCVRRIGRWNRAAALVRLLIRGVTESWRLSRANIVAAAPRRTQSTQAPALIRRPTLSIVVLSFNRWPALEKTLTSLRADPAADGAEIIVVDNGSVDGTPDKVAARFPSVKLIALRTNIGIGGFNDGVRASNGEAVLILDDDAWPGERVLSTAMDLLANRPDIGAVALHPTHPHTRQSEWSFAKHADDHWPVMGCANLVRRTAWDRVGGYEDEFFLYRNDVDLAMKLLDAGFRVHFDPNWIVWHDSPAAAKKSLRWFELATRNWVWLCRRHGRGVIRWKSTLAGWLWAHKLAGFSPLAHLAAVKGGLGGLLSRAPAMPVACNQRLGVPAYMRLRFGG